MKKVFVLIVVGVGVSAYLAGRYSAPETVDRQKEISALTTENASLRKELAESMERLSAYKRTRETERVRLPDGTKIYRSRSVATHDSSERTTRTESAEILTASQTQIHQKESEQIKNRRGVVASLLVGAQFDKLALGASYGAGISRQFWGPFHLGLNLVFVPAFAAHASLGFEL